jgi:hypothetical protein
MPPRRARAPSCRLDGLVPPHAASTGSCPLMPPQRARAPSCRLNGLVPPHAASTGSCPLMPPRRARAPSCRLDGLVPPHAASCRLMPRGGAPDWLGGNLWAENLWAYFWKLKMLGRIFRGRKSLGGKCLGVFFVGGNLWAENVWAEISDAYVYASVYRCHESAGPLPSGCLIRGRRRCRAWAARPAPL